MVLNPRNTLDFVYQIFLSIEYAFFFKPLQGHMPSFLWRNS